MFRVTTRKMTVLAMFRESVAVGTLPSKFVLDDEAIPRIRAT